MEQPWHSAIQTAVVSSWSSADTDVQAPAAERPKPHDRDVGPLKARLPTPSARGTRPKNLDQLTKQVAQLGLRLLENQGISSTRSSECRTNRIEGLGEPCYFPREPSGALHRTDYAVNLLTRALSGKDARDWVDLYAVSQVWGSLEGLAVGSALKTDISTPVQPLRKLRKVILATPISRIAQLEGRPVFDEPNALRSRAIAAVDRAVCSLNRASLRYKRGLHVGVDGRAIEAGKKPHEVRLPMAQRLDVDFDSDVLPRPVPDRR